MRSVFIIGNGFDLAHNIDSSYESFRKYLKKQYPNTNEDDFVLPDRIIDRNGEDVFCDEEAVSFLLRIISKAEGEQWNDVETSLGLLDFSECFDDIFYERDEDGDIDSWKQVYTNEDIASNILLPTLNVTKYFSDWVYTIHIGGAVEAKKDFMQLLDKENDLFLSFNYTDTLERIYNVKNVVHIHGKQGEKILFGHGNTEDYYESNMDQYIGAENILDEIQNRLKKDTSSALRQHQYFFDAINEECDKVYTYGFSFSEVDQIYIKKICEKLSDHAVWYLNDYDDVQKRERYTKIIRACGFFGKMDTYHIS